VPEPGETPSDIFNAGFLRRRATSTAFTSAAGAGELAKFKPSSENRRILRKGAGIDVKLVPRDKYNYTPDRGNFQDLRRHQIRQGCDDVRAARRAVWLAIISHLLVFTDTKTGAEIGAATLYIEGRELAYYYYAFYDLNYYGAATSACT